MYVTIYKMNKICLNQASEARGSEEEDFLIFSTHYYDSNLGLSEAGPFCIPGPTFIQVW